MLAVMILFSATVRKNMTVHVTIKEIGARYPAALLILVRSCVNIGVKTILFYIYVILLINIRRVTKLMFST